MGINHHKIVNTLELWRIDRTVQRVHSGGIFCRDILIRNLGEMTIGQVDIFNMAIVASINCWHLGGERMDIIKIDISNSIKKIVIVNAN